MRKSQVEDLRGRLATGMPEGPWLFPEDQLMELSERLFAAEITREQIFRQLHQELPYAAAVTTDKWTDNADGSARVDQTIFVERDGQKAIVIGASERSSPFQGSTPLYDSTLTSRATDPASKRLRTTPGASIP